MGEQVIFFTMDVYTMKITNESGKFHITDPCYTPWDTYRHAGAYNIDAAKGSWEITMQEEPLVIEAVHSDHNSNIKPTVFKEIDIETARVMFIDAQFYPSKQQYRNFYDTLGETPLAIVRTGMDCAMQVSLARNRKGNATKIVLHHFSRH